MGISIAIVGAGRVGSVFGYKLAKAGNDVSFVARPGSERLRYLREKKGIVLTTGEFVAAKVAEKLDTDYQYDLVIVTVLAHQVDSLVNDLMRSQAKNIHFMFMNFDCEPLQNAFGAGRSSFGIPFVQANFDDVGDLKFSSGFAKTLHSNHDCVKLFNDAGIPSAFEPNATLWLRCHVPVTVGMESISVMAEQHSGGATWLEAITVARGMQAAWRLIRKMGYPLYPAPKALMNASPSVFLAALLWSVSRIKSFRTLLATGINECRALLTVLEEAALEQNEPVLALAISLLKP